MNGTNGLRRTFAVPALIAASSLVGLVAALLGDGPWDLVSWIGLSPPVAAVILAWRARRPAARPVTADAAE